MGESDASVAGARIGRPNRLPRRADFLRLTASRHKIATPGFLLQGAPSPQPAASAAGGSSASIQPTLRIGFTTSRKIGNAVQRNRARRRLRALAAAVMPGLARDDWDYVLVARGPALDREFAAMAEDLRGALQRMSVRKERRS